MYQNITCESVRAGHPDKVCDFISDRVLDAYLQVDKCGRVAIECLGTKGVIIVAGETNLPADSINIDSIVRQALLDRGYDSKKKGTNPHHIKIIKKVHGQSIEIAQGVNAIGKHKVFGAGDQGIVYGYAEKNEYNNMPLPMFIAQRIVKSIDVLGKDPINKIYPDGKVMVEVEYQNDEPSRIASLTIACQHGKSIKPDNVKELIIKHISSNEELAPIFAKLGFNENTKTYFNETGKFTVGGFNADTGLTGRKLEVDTYGGCASHGGGAYSGKECSKVDRSGSYMARYIANHIVNSGLCKKCEIQIVYVIGMAEPISVDIETFGTNKIDRNIILQKIKEYFNMTPQGIIDTLKLRDIKFSELSAYGHYGWNYPWDIVNPNIISELTSLLG